MIVYNNQDLKGQLLKDCVELEKFNNSYNEKIKLYNTFLGTMDIFKEENINRSYLNKENLNNKVIDFKNQVIYIEKCIGYINDLLSLENISVDKNEIKTYNKNYKKIKNNYINNCLVEENITKNYVDGLMFSFARTVEEIQQDYDKKLDKITNKTEEILNHTNENSMINNIEQSRVVNNDTLLISEVLNKVVLPYTSKEITEILNSDNSYNNAEEVIEDKFTRPLSDFKSQFASRYNETMKLAREREKYGVMDSIILATEMMKKRYLHPAIIAACRNLNELDVYIDCLDKNEVEEFKIFKIRYELYPVVVAQKRRGNHFKEESKMGIWKKITKIFTGKTASNDYV